MKRLPFKTLSASDLTHFQSFLSPSQIIEDPSQLLPYNQDWTSKYKGHSPLCLLPKTTQQVS
jgi:D-lactate dehydrogenase (cytochrome)